MNKSKGINKKYFFVVQTKKCFLTGIILKATKIWVNALNGKHYPRAKIAINLDFYETYGCTL